MKVQIIIFYNKNTLKINVKQNAWKFTCGNINNQIFLGDDHAPYVKGVSEREWDKRKELTVTEGGGGDGKGRRKVICVVKWEK
jgi:hypothetical protein